MSFTLTDLEKLEALHSRGAESIIGIHNAFPAMAKALRVAHGKLQGVGDLLSENGCDCDCNHTDYYEPHDAECEPCLVCRISAVIGGRGDELKETK